MFKQINNPNSGVKEEFIEFVNNYGSALAHGDVVVLDLSNITTTTPYEYAASSTTEGDNTILGVVYDPEGYGVAVGAVGIAMRKGISKVKTGTSAIGTASVTTRLKHSGSALTAAVVSSGTTLEPGAMIGYIIGSKTTAVTTVDAFIDVK